MLRMRLSDVAGGVGAENKGEGVNERFWSSSEGCTDPADCSFDFDRLTLLVGTCDIELQQRRDEARGDYSQRGACGKIGQKEEEKKGDGLLV